MNLYGISNILTAVTSLFLAIFVYFRAHERKLGRIWSLFALSAAFYGFGAYMMSNSTDISRAFFWWRIAYIGIIPLPFFFVWTAYEFLNIRRPLVIKLMGGLTIIYLILNFSLKKILLSDLALYFTDMKWVKPLYFASPTHPLLLFFIIFNFFGWVAYGHLELIKNYHKLTGARRNQARYFFFAATLGFLGGGTSFLPCFGISFYPILNFAVPLYFIITAYAILRYRLMDIKVAITRTGIFIAVYSFLLGVPFFTALRFKSALMDLFGINWWILPTAIMAASATLGPFIYIYLQHKAERRLFREQRTYQDTLKQSAREMARVHNFRKLLNLIVHTVTKVARISHASIFLFDQDTGNFMCKASRGIKIKEPRFLPMNNPLVVWFNNNREPLIAEEVAGNSLREEMNSFDTGLVVPGFLDRKLIGLLMLGAKRSGKMYTIEDIDTFSLLASQATLAIENAVLYESIEEQVKQRTDELVEVQKQLVQAEKLATVGTLAGGVAHEINNPLTAILTNVQMLLAEGEAQADRESLQLIEEATKRCRTIVQKLMAYAKKPLETAEVKEVSMLDAVQKVLSFLSYQMEQDNIKITLDAKKGDYPVMGNHNEMEQVITNILINSKDAIKHHKRSGEIHISLTKNGEWVKATIKDDGAGIPKNILPKIFDPFFTTKEIGKGLGLGLSICHSIVEKHSGTITVDSEPGKGSTFTVQLPEVKKGTVPTEDKTASAV